MKEIDEKMLKELRKLHAEYKVIEPTLKAEGVYTSKEVKKNL